MLGRPSTVSALPSASASPVTPAAGSAPEAVVDSGREIRRGLYRAGSGTLVEARRLGELALRIDGRALLHHEGGHIRSILGRLVAAGCRHPEQCAQSENGNWFHACYLP